MWAVSCGISLADCMSLYSHRLPPGNFSAGPMVRRSGATFKKSARAPSLRTRRVESPEVQHSTDGLVDNIRNRLGTGVKRWNGRHEDRSDTRGIYHQLAVTDVQGRFSEQEQQPSSLFQGH